MGLNFANYDFKFIIISMPGLLSSRPLNRAPYVGEAPKLYYYH